MGRGGQRHILATLLPKKETTYPLYRCLGGLQGRSGQVQKISFARGFDQRIVQPVESRYTE
jgi:dsDNA-specific endonuclease/ATPase MutS2